VLDHRLRSYKEARDRRILTREEEAVGEEQKEGVVVDKVEMMSVIEKVSQDIIDTNISMTSLIQNIILFAPIMSKQLKAVPLYHKFLENMKEELSDLALHNISVSFEVSCASAAVTPTVNINYNPKFAELTTSIYECKTRNEVQHIINAFDEYLHSKNEVNVIRTSRGDLPFVSYNGDSIIIQFVFLLANQEIYRLYTQTVAVVPSILKMLIKQRFELELEIEKLKQQLGYSELVHFQWGLFMREIEKMRTVDDYKKRILIEKFQQFAQQERITEVDPNELYPDTQPVENNMLQLCTDANNAMKNLDDRVTITEILKTMKLTAFPLQNDIIIPLVMNPNYVTFLHTYYYLIITIILMEYTLKETTTTREVLDRI
jgi:hypothetical protein